MISQLCWSFFAYSYIYSAFRALRAWLAHRQFLSLHVWLARTQIYAPVYDPLFCNLNNLGAASHWCCQGLFVFIVFPLMANFYVFWTFPPFFLTFTLRKHLLPLNIVIKSGSRLVGTLHASRPLQGAVFCLSACLLVCLSVLCLYCHLSF